MGKPNMRDILNEMDGLEEQYLSSKIIAKP